jgi:hypothetical protein
MNGNCELHSEHRVEGQDGNAWESVENWQTLATRMHSTAPQPAQLGSLVSLLLHEAQAL